MLQLKKNIVYTIKDVMLGWFDDDVFRPSQVIVGSTYDEAALSQWLGVQVKDLGLYSFGKRIATVSLGENGKISDLTLDAQK